MEIKDICIDKEYAKKLFELKVKQDSIYSWYVHTKIKVEYLQESGLHQYDTDVIYSAFTSTELLEMLPNYIGIMSAGGGRHGERCGFTIIEEFNEYIVKWGSKDEYKSKIICERNKLSNALAEMLIYLIENKLMEVKNDNNNR